MKRLIFALLFLLGALQHGIAAPYSIVFVHIGDELPPYLETAIAQAWLFNPDADIFLIANERAETHFSKKAASVPVKIVTCESLKPGDAHMNFLQKSSLDRHWRSGFWNHTLERFFFLEDFLAQFDIENVFHLENDNMLYVDLEELLPIFKKYYPGIGATFDNDQRCIAGFIYISNHASMQKLAQYIADRAHQGHVDMRILALYKDEHGPDSIDYLPVVPTKYVEVLQLSSPSGIMTRNPYRFHNHFSSFQSIFDAAALGQYLGGIDPILGVLPPMTFINESAVYNPSRFTYTWSQDKDGRKIPYAAFGNHRCRINSLHIHSKRLDDFYSK